MQKLKSFNFWRKTYGNTKSFFSIFFLCFAILSYGQVRTTGLQDSRLEDLIPNHSTKSVTNVIVMPRVDIRKVLRQDSLEGRIPPRYGVKISTAITKNDGEIDDKGHLVIWKTSVRSANATSLNFHISNLSLPEGSELYIYNKAGTMVSGPVTNIHVYEGQYATDAINGEEVILEVILPKETFENFSISIQNVIHGFKNFGIITPRAYDDSGTCNIDVKCASGVENQRDAVALIFNANGEHCSGALINNGCEDIRSFFLTANHCLDGNQANWVFRFNYDSPNPAFPNCRADEPTTWLTYSGSTLRASNATSDFALLELTGSIIGQSTLSLAGWDRSSTTPASGTGIHHPSGDVKKISGTTGTPTITSSTGGTGTDYVRVIWGLGTTEGGSSGSPLYDANKRIVGQLFGGTASCALTTDPDYYGRFFSSWTGGGTNTTRLSNWLGGSAVPTTTNTIRSPFISGSGSGPVCSSPSQTFTLNNSISGRTVTWAATPASLFVTSSGTGTSATLQATSLSGTGTLTFTISAASGCNPIVIAKSFWVGPPVYNSGITGSNYLCTNQSGSAYLTVLYNPTPQNASISWTYSGALQLFYGSGQSATYNGASSPGNGIIYANISNTCGTTSPSMFFQVVSCFRGDDISMKVSPNPSVDFADIEINQETIGSDVKLENGDLTLYDKLGKVVLVTKFNGNREKIDISRLAPDIYFVEIVFGTTRIREKILITR